LYSGVRRIRFPLVSCLTVFSVLALSPAVWAVDFEGTLPAATDLPQTHAFLTDSDGDVLSGYDIQDDPTYDIEAYLDTGTSGILLSQETQEGFGVDLATYDGQPVTFQDIAIGGSTTYSVSVPYTVNIAPFSTNDDQSLDNPVPPQSAYTNTYGPVQFEVSQTPDPDVGLGLPPTDVFGMAVMQNKVTVIDMRPANAGNYLFNPTDSSTYVYPPNTPYQPATLDTNPGIVPAQYHVKLSNVLLNQFTVTSPSGAPGPVYNSNPFIGPNPLNQLNPNAPPDNTPPVSIAYNNLQANGSFLFDTGAQLSFISSAMAAKLNVEYEPGTENTDDADLINTVTGQDIPNQFTTELEGAGGSTITAAGFYLTSLTLQTVEGVPLNFLGAPVLVQDITLQEPNGGPSITLDGDLGMNFFEPSYDPSALDFIGGDFDQQNSPFDWVEFDQPDGLLGLQLTGVPLVLPTPSSTWNATGGGSWNLASNWQSGTTPQSSYQIINFAGSITAPSTVTLDGSVTAGSVNFDSTYSYTIAAGTGGSLTLNNNGSTANITDSGGTHSITAPMILDSSVLITVANAGDALNISGNISGPGGLSTAGGGTVKLSGSDSYLGPTAANSGMLLIAASGALPNNTSLSIGTSTTTAAVALSSGFGRVRLSVLNINAGSTLDIANNAVILNYVGSSPEATIQSYVASGLVISSFVAGNSGYAIAYADGGDPQEENNLLQPGQMVIEPALTGDADLNGTVNIHDLQDLISDFNQPGYWDEGNFNNHAVVDISDLQALLSNFNNSATLEFSEQSSIEILAAEFGDVAIPNADGKGFSLVSVPEPASAGMALLAAAGLLRRKNRR
jgi:hypothetical protein